MTFHSRSVVSFGQLLNALTRTLTDGGPITGALGVVRDQFDASAVVLGIERRGHGFAAFFTSESEEIHHAASRERPAALDAMIEDSQHVVARESDADGAVEYVLFVFRPRMAPAFDVEERALAGVLATQVARALDLAARIDASAVEKSLYSDALDRLNVGVISVHASGKIVSASPVAARLLAARDGLQAQAGKLRAALTGEDRELQAAIRAAAQPGANGGQGASRGVALTKQCGARTLGVMIRPALIGAARGAAPVAVFVRDGDSMPEVESEFVRQIFDLTPAEAAVTRRLTSGLSLEDAATSLDISRNTARAHLRSIFSKSGITRQTELVRLVLNSAVILGEGARRQAA